MSHNKISEVKKSSDFRPFRNRKAISEVKKSSDFRPFRNRKAISEVVAYVLLIVMAIAMSILVYAWLKGFIFKPETKCPDGISLSVDDYFCENNKINITLKNTGNFNLEGYLARVANTTKGRAIYFLKMGNNIENYFSREKGVLKPEERYNVLFSIAGLGTLTKLEIEPFREVDKQIVLCTDKVISQEIRNCNGAPVSCTPDCSCSSAVCIGQTCSNGCGGTCPGTASCECSANSDCPTAPAFCQGSQACMPVPICTNPGTPSSDCGFNNDCVNCPLGCANGECNGGVGSCSDSDGGIFPNIFGIVSYNGEDSEDSCVSPMTIAERYCLEGIPSTQYPSCPGGCISGACRQLTGNCIVGSIYEYLEGYGQEECNLLCAGFCSTNYPGSITAVSEVWSPSLCRCGCDVTDLSGCCNYEEKTETLSCDSLDGDITACQKSYFMLEQTDQMPCSWEVWAGGAACESMPGLC